MTPFDLVEPTSLKEALGLLDADDPSVRPIGGGTALMLMMKAGVFRPTRLVSLRKVGGFAGIKAAADGSLTIASYRTALPFHQAAGLATDATESTSPSSVRFGKATRAFSPVLIRSIYDSRIPSFTCI